MNGESHGAHHSARRRQDTSPSRRQEAPTSKKFEERTFINNSNRESFLDDVLTRELAAADRARKHKHHH
jgi:hypothetical protein